MTTIDTVAFLGGVRVFGRPLVSESDLAAEIARGFPPAALDTVLDTLRSDLISLTSIYEVVGDAQTLQRKLQQHAQLSSEESERLARLARVAVRTAEALGSTEKGTRSLAKANRALDGRRPLDMLATEDGARLVADVLGRIEHGVMA